MIIKVIPNYPKNIKKDFIFIIDINKKCENLLKKIDEENVFNSPQSKKLIIYFNKFLIFQELGHFKDISNYCFENEDVNFIVYLERKLEENMDLFFNPVSLKFEEEKYENDETGFKLFFESFEKFKDKIKIEENICIIFSDSDSDSDSD